MNKFGTAVALSVLSASLTGSAYAQDRDQDHHDKDNHHYVEHHEWKKGVRIRDEDWNRGEKVIIAGSVSNDEAKETYPDGWEEPRPYIRLVPQPS